MPTISAGDKVLITGANGFIAIWVVRTLLEKGYAVKGTVRTADKGKFLRELFKSYGDKFEVVVVEDITKEEAFDEIIKDVHAIAHTASPFYLNAPSVDELIKPAVDGTVAVLKSALKNGKDIKRIIVLSSCASVLEIGADKVFSEDDWNNLAMREVEEQGDGASGITKYRASKTLAEKAAWDFYNENKAKASWDLTVLNPPFVFGPNIHDVKSPQDLNTSSRSFYETVLVDGKSKEYLTVQGSAWVDVRDLADAHVFALEKEAAGGERIIVAAGSYVWQDFVDTAHSLSPTPIPSHPNLPIGYPGAGKTAKAPVAYNTAKAARILGMKYRSIETLVRDTLVDFEARGW